MEVQGLPRHCCRGKENSRQGEKKEVTFKNLLHAYNGKCDGIVYYYNKRMGKVIARRHS